jgi:hypothetical protein
MHDIFRNHADQILTFVNTVELLFPEFRFPNRTRTSRDVGLCTLCGRYYQKLYNLATVEDIQTLNHLLQKQAELSGRRFDELENELSAFASFSHITTTKLQALTHITETLNKRSITVEAEAHRRSFQISELIVLCRCLILPSCYPRINTIRVRNSDATTRFINPNAATSFSSQHHH